MSEPPPPQESLLQTLQALVRELPLMLSDRIELLSLELQRAGDALARMVAMVVAAAVAGATAWLLLWAVIVQALVHAGLPWWAALLLPLAVNVGVAWAAVAHARRLSALLTLPATRRHLTVSPSTTPPAGAPSAATSPPGPTPHDAPAQATR
jgi:Putative Actinobacterial Holin-X, holin superfamily III